MITSTENKEDMIKCPFCAEEIRLEAKKCKHCMEILDPALHKEQSGKMFNSGTAALLSLIIPGAGQMYKGQVGNGLVWFIVVIIGYTFLIIPGLILHLCCIIGAASESSKPSQRQKLISKSHQITSAEQIKIIITKLSSFIDWTINNSKKVNAFLVKHTPDAIRKIRRKPYVSLTILAIAISFAFYVGVNSKENEQNAKKSVINNIPTNNDKLATDQNSSLNNESSSNTSNKNARDNIVLPTYTILSDITDDIPIKTQVEMQILVEGELNEEGLKSLLLKLKDEISSKTGYEYHKHPTHIVIYAYSNKEQVETSSWLAMLSQIGENAIAELNVNIPMLTSLNQPQNIKFGLTENERKKFWKEIIAAEDRAQREADMKYPIVMNTTIDRINQNTRYAEQMFEKYAAPIRQEYGLTVNQSYEVTGEAATLGWPME